jgi:DNA-3-methyladenine glycosylase II
MRRIYEAKRIMKKSRKTKVFRLEIKLPDIFDYQECLWFLHRNYDECLYQIHEDSIHRSIRLEGQIYQLYILHEDGKLMVHVQGRPSPTIEHVIRKYITDWLGLDHHLKAFYEKLAQASALRYMIREFWGLSLVGIPDMFEAICWCIIGQQINLTFAYRLKRRLVERYGCSTKGGDHQLWLFPQPKDILAANPQELRDMQFSRQKIQYLMHVAKAFEQGLLDRDQCRNLPTQKQRLAYLERIKGIGPWTANYVLMKCVRDVRAVPYGDAGLLGALEKHQLIRHRKDFEAIHLLFKAFTGFESYLVIYLWRSLAPKPS